MYLQALKFLYLKVAKPAKRKIQTCTQDTLDKSSVHSNDVEHGVIIEGKCINISNICDGALNLDFFVRQANKQFMKNKSISSSFQMQFKHPWILSTEHMAICRNITFWSTFKNSHCQHGKISCNSNSGPGFCTANITWQEGKCMVLCEK